MMKELQQIPLLRLLLPFMTGIVVREYSSSLFPTMACCAWLTFLLVALWVTHKYISRAFGAFTFVFFFSLGFTLLNAFYGHQSFSFPTEDQYYQVLLVDNPDEKEKSVLCEVQVQSVWTSDSVYQIPVTHPKCLLYLAKDSASLSLLAGQQILVKTSWQQPKNNGNPHEFDYVAYLHHRGVTATAYAPKESWQLIKGGLTPSWKQKALAYRKRMGEYYQSLSFKGDEWNILRALTLGDKDDLSDSIKETYSVAGASHVLALSGLHIGLITALLMYLLAPLTWLFTGGRYLRLLLVLASLFAFAYFTGFSPSVVRSVVMFSLLSIAYVRSLSSFSLSVVVTTAFIMLIIHPVWLFDVGFQLSFVAVTAILILQPPLQRLLQPKTRLGRMIWGLMTVSVAAQIGTAPLVLFYFSRFSTHFLLTNLWVIPMVTIVLYVAVLMLLLTPFPVIQIYVAKLLNQLITWQNEGLQLIEKIPYASIDHVWINACQVFLMYLLFIAFFYFCKKRSYRSTLSFLSVLLLSLTYQCWLNKDRHTEAGVAFYASYNQPAVHLLSDNATSWMVFADSQAEVSKSEKMMNQHWNYLRLKRPKAMFADQTVHQEELLIDHAMISYAGKRICFLRDKRWQQLQSSSKLVVDYLYVCRGFKGDFNKLTTLFTLKKVILDTSLSRYYVTHIIDCCLQQGIPYINLSKSGCFQESFS